nr:hypothetical protein [Acidovorax sp. JHL-9]
MNTVAPHAGFASVLAGRSTVRDAITAAHRRPETEALKGLLCEGQVPDDDHTQIQALALALAQRIAPTLRERQAFAARAGLVQGRLQQFSLSSQQGVARMCLAEALQAFRMRPRATP